MSFLNRLFGRDSSNKDQPDISFGRYSDAYKDDTQYDAWDKAIEQFEQENYLDSYQTFFSYLRDEKEDNVKFELDKGVLQFEFVQGSRKIVGTASNKKIIAKAKIVKTNKNLKVDFMRRLLEQNYDLKYSRFCLDSDDHLAIIFDTYSVDGSPYKLYYALKELATNADKQDDLLLDEFRSLDAINLDHLRPIPIEEKEAKYKYINRAIKKVVDEVNSKKLDAKQYPGGIAYLLLDLVYKLDFLTKPEGFMMEALERIHRLYFANAGQPSPEKNAVLLKELEQLLERPKEDYFKEMYRTTSTFGITTAVNYSRVVNFIEGELGNMYWYDDNGYDEVACSVPGYIVGYCLFNYAVPKPCKDLFQLYYQILEPGYFYNLGFQTYRAKDGTFNVKGIKKAIKRLVDLYSSKYEGFVPNTSMLDFKSTTAFAMSYLKMMEVLEMTKLD